MVSGGRDHYKIVVIGASAGGIEASKQLLDDFPADLPAAVFLVIHIPATHKSHLTKIMSRNGKLTAKNPEDGEQVRPGNIYIAPPGRHMIIHGGVIRLTMGPHENGHRPALDPLFRSAAAEYGSRVTGVILSGNLDDGVAGLKAIQKAGGMTIAQDPNEAPFPGMPENAIRALKLDHVLPVKRIAGVIRRSLAEAAPVAAIRQMLLNGQDEAEAQREAGGQSIEEWTHGEHLRNHPDQKSADRT